MRPFAASSYFGDEAFDVVGPAEEADAVGLDEVGSDLGYGCGRWGRGWGWQDVPAGQLGLRGGFGQWRP
ncbi:hypothetical protein DPM19_31665 [Actinomadura craniellae]|uniref:Uncharacterized protein n=1 Tax=Actinomadura craniellae TaxID=2231787 RepID=A0A365GW94_9ACTN|nr:hypothetical protein DPM19_31665 [Actinomadura craniellae]